MSPLTLWQKVAAIGVAALLLATVSFGAGWQVRTWKADADQLKAVAAAEKERDKATAKLDAQSASFENERAALQQRAVETRSTIREIYRDVPAPPPECAAPPAARRLLIDAGARGTSTAPGEPSGGVPGAAGASADPHRP